MKEKIDNLLEQLHKKEIDMIELRNQLLLLYNVSGRSEQFVCGANRVMGEKRCERQCG